MKLLTKILLPLVVLISCNVNAAFILNNDNSNVVNAFNLSESFKSFYGYASSVRASSNTGFEQTNTAVFLIAQYQGQYSLIATFGSFVANGDPDGGSLTLGLTNNGFGNFLFIDDPSETVSTTGNFSSINFNYLADRTDGFIFDLGDGTNVDLSILMSNLVGVDNFQFLNAGGTDYSLSSQFNLSLFDNSASASPVVAPNGLFLLVLSLLIVFSVRKRRFKTGF